MEGPVWQPHSRSAENQHCCIWDLETCSLSRTTLAAYPICIRVLLKNKVEDNLQTISGIPETIVFVYFIKCEIKLVSLQSYSETFLK